MEKDTQVMVGDPVQVPDGLLEAVCQLAAQREIFGTLWLRQMVRARWGTEPHHRGYTTPATRLKCSSYCRSRQRPLRPAAVDMIPYGTGFAEAATEDSQPFYHKD